jgi:DNA-binding NtrC family response regulator
LFVDDEKRVLNSMRAMFRRDYELFLTTRGDEALRIIAEQPIDVLVADQRMPLMTGVEVLTAAKKCSPGTVRILLTGYSDLDAIQGAMNDGEVFRFLNKPCAATELRGTIFEAAKIARDTGHHARGAATNVGDADVDALSANSAAPIVIKRKKSRSITERILTRRGRNGATPPNGAAAGPAKSDIAPISPNGDFDHRAGDTMEIVMAGDTVTIVDSSGEHKALVDRSGEHRALVDPSRPAPVPEPGATQPVTPQPPVLQPANRIRCVGRGKYNISVMIFSPDDQFARSIGRSLDGTFYTFHATNAVRLLEGIASIAPAVLITDVTTDPDVIQNLTGMLKKKIPALVTMVAGQHRDAEVMIKLINHGQVFRFIDKPLSSTGCQKHVREALKRHIVLRKNPALADRYSVRDTDASVAGRLGETLVKGLNRVRRLWAHDR